jgi:fructokinase
MRIGIDLGGTKIEILALDDEGRELVRRRVPTPQGDYPGTVRAIAGLVAAVEAERGETGTVGVGIPGAISPATGLVKNANSTILNGRPLDRDLVEALGRPVRLSNDANCFALSEAVDGAGRAAHVVFGVILGTGVGAGITVGRKVLSGRHLIAGEWGHNPLPWPSLEEVREAPACYCGRKGCIETWLSGPGFAAEALRATGRQRSPDMLVAEALAGEPGAAAAYRRYVDRLGRGLAHVVNILDPGVIVLGGGMGKIEPLYADLGPVLAAHVFSDQVTTPIVCPVHGDSSGVRGAAWLWPAATDPE